MKYIIIGGVAGGATTAARLRRVNESCEIILIERGADISYANCGLPYYIGGTIKNRDELFVQTPGSFGTRFKIDVRVRNEALSINPNKKTVEIKSLNNGKIYHEVYDKLVISPGAEPVRPNLPGIDDPAIFTLRNVPDTDKIKKFVEEKQPKRAVVIGAGFIGLEMAENLHEKGINVSIVEMADQVMTPLDYSMASIVHQHLKTKNVEFFLKDAVTSFSNKNGHLQVQLNSGRILPTDLVILSIGVKPESKLAKEAGLTIGETGGIKVNQFLQTSDHDIYAVGDAIEFPHPITRKGTITYLAGPANRQGRIAADNIAFGNKRSYTGSIATAIAKVFDITVASTGLSGKTLKKEGIPYRASITHSSSHAGYYPGAQPMSIKIVFSPDNGKLYGAQIVGYDGVDKRIDLLATIIKNNGTVYDLQEIEHAYAPPYSSAKDPVNIAGYVAENILNGTTKNITWREFTRVKNDEVFILDVRTQGEYAMSHIKNAVNIPLDNLRQNMDSLPRDKNIVVYCAVGLRGYLATRLLLQNGYKNIFNLSGGFKTYQHAIQKQSNEDIFENEFIGKDDHIYQKGKC